MNRFPWSNRPPVDTEPTQRSVASSTEDPQPPDHHADDAVQSHDPQLEASSQHPEVISPSGSPGQPGRTRLILSITLVIVVSLIVAGWAVTNIVSYFVPRAFMSEPPESCETRGSQNKGHAWKEAWSLDTGLPRWEKHYRWDSYVCGDYLVIIDRKDINTADLMGYYIGDGKPRRIWSTSLESADTGTFRNWWGGHLLLDDRALDPVTGKTSATPWELDSFGFVANDNLAVSCSSPHPQGDSTCTGWDWNGGHPVQRWQQTFKFTSVFPNWINEDGTRSAEHIAVSLENDPGGESRIGVLSTSDGTLRTLAPKKNNQGHSIQVVQARDGWITIDPDGSTASTFSPEGDPAGTFALNGSQAALLIKDGQPPTLGQFQKAYESGDTSWADIAISCTDTSQCTFNDAPLTLSDGITPSDTPVRAHFQNSWRLSSDGRTLAIRNDPGSRNAGAVLLVDTASKSPLSSLPISSRRTSIAVWRRDMVVAIDGSKLIGYTPGS